MKPENVLIDSDGYAKLTDFGLAKENVKANTDTTTMCGTPEYLAPEVIGRKGHGKAVDWWSVGCIIFEMLTGNPPFTLKGDDKNQLFDDIKNIAVNIPAFLSPDCQDLLKKIFVLDPNQRLGGGAGDVEDFKSHSWFSGVDWDAIYNKSVKPPFKPKLASEMDVKYIDSTFTEQLPTETPESLAIGSLMGGKWEGFTYEADKKL